MINSTTIFKKLIDQREYKIKEHCKTSSWEEICDKPEEMEWYAETIATIDEKIFKVSNAIIVKYSIPCRSVKTIEDVYANKWLMKIVKNTHRINEENSLTK